MRRVCAVQGVSKTLAEVLDMSQEWNWKARVAAYDNHLDAVLLQEREAMLKEDARTRTAAHLSLLHDARDMVANELRKLLAWSERAEGVGIMQPQQLSKFMELTVKLERLVVGESTENNSTSLDLSGLTIDELKVVQGILAKAGHAPVAEFDGNALNGLTDTSRSSKPS